MKKNIPKYVFDSYAVFVFLNQEKGYLTVEKLLTQARDKKVALFLSLVNLGEIYYILIREVGEDKAANLVAKIENLPVVIVDVDRKLTLQAAQIKAKGGLSYADSFAVATAIITKATLVTGDSEFKKFNETVTIKWL